MDIFTRASFLTCVLTSHVNHIHEAHRDDVTSEVHPASLLVLSQFLLDADSYIQLR